MIYEVLFEEDLQKIVDAVNKYPLGSHQIGEIARLSGLIQERGIDVVELLSNLCVKYNFEFK